MHARRRFLAAGLALLFDRRWPIGDRRSAWAQLVNPPPPIRYVSLTRPVKILLEDVATPWQPVPFVAEARLRDTRSGAASSERRVLISGVLFRTHTQLSALCITCPHEQCQVDLVTDQERLDRMIPRLGSGQVGQKVTHPLFECGCHFSVFDAANEGARVSGESPRGLYRFRIAGTSQDMVEITDIEEVALLEV